MASSNSLKFLPTATPFPYAVLAFASHIQSLTPQPLLLVASFDPELSSNLELEFGAKKLVDAAEVTHELATVSGLLGDNETKVGEGNLLIRTISF